MVKSTKKSNNLKNISLIIIILLIGFVLGNYYNSTKSSSSNSSKQETTSEVIPSGWFTYTHERFPKPSGWETYPWVGFKMHYPSSWTIDEERRDETTGDLIIHGSKKDGSYFDLAQGFGEGGTCLFPDDTDYTTFQGMGNKYSKYVQIDKPDVQWRLATYEEASNLWTHSLCEAENGRYYSSNVIGIHKIKLTTQESIDEFTEILQKLELLK